MSVLLTQTPASQSTVTPAASSTGAVTIDAGQIAINTLKSITPELIAIVAASAGAAASSNPTVAILTNAVPIITAIMTALQQIQQANGMSDAELQQLYQTTGQGLVQIAQAWQQYAATQAATTTKS